MGLSSIRANVLEFLKFQNIVNFLNSRHERLLRASFAFFGKLQPSTRQTQNKRQTSRVTSAEDKSRYPLQSKIQNPRRIRTYQAASNDTHAAARHQVKSTAARSHWTRDSTAPDGQALFRHKMSSGQSSMPDGSLCKLTEARTRCAGIDLANAQSQLSSARLAACAELVKADPLPDEGDFNFAAENLPPANRLAFCRERVFAHMELQTVGHIDYDAEAAAVDDLRFHREKLSVASTIPEFKSISDSFSATEALQDSIESLQNMVLKAFYDQRQAAKADAAALKSELDRLHIKFLELLRVVERRNS
jgi:hypothetical protein